ncbi:MAG: hypothetical protein A49_04580 [Methyloceanibacter sp.]|nr:MAG: hypothetical protein A49_04580 [Methyloceanibacter sp.]
MEPMSMKLPRPIPAGTRVRVTQKIVLREATWPCEVEGTVITHEAATTPSWYAHLPKKKLWLNRLRLQKDDGEITLLNLDADSEVTVLKRA